jgi:3-phosphoshikimate 1-carboxyvinyltransferase
MSQVTVQRAEPLRGRVRVPGDKSLSHRAVLLGSIAQGDSRIRGFLRGGDCLATVSCMRGLGITVDEPDETTLVVHGRGLYSLQEPLHALDCRSSGTTMRLLAGLVAGAGVMTVLAGSDQLSRRPMARVAEPLRRMGAVVLGRQGGRLPPLAIQGGALRGIDYPLPVASAQVKSAIVLAGLYTPDLTVVHEHPQGTSRDHTERMLRAMGAPINNLGVRVTSERPAQPLQPLDLEIPADMSSAAFLLAAALLVPASRIELPSVLLNPTRTGLFDVLAAMGGHLVVEDTHEVAGEPVGDIVVQHSPLHGTRVAGDIVVRGIDEMPILAVAATQAQGTTVVRDAAELRVKETDRIATIVEELRQLGAQIEAMPDGFVVEGPTALRGSVVDSHGDHRLAMALIVAGLVAQGETTVRDTDCIADSFPGFERLLIKLGAELA